MRIVSISDTHGKHEALTIPDGDVLVHAGDITYTGELSIMRNFSKWLKTLPHKHKICIFGNHELGFRTNKNKRNKAIKLIKKAGAHYLENSEIVIDGLKFYGSPATPWFRDWEWNYERGPQIAAVWNQIPKDTNVLITHGPPFGILDDVPYIGNQTTHEGCQDLLNYINNNLFNLKAHIFGHIHHGYGIKQETIDNVHSCYFINASSCTEAVADVNGNEDYVLANKPIIIDI